MADPDIQIGGGGGGRGRSSPAWDKGMPGQFGLKIRGGGRIRHCKWLKGNKLYNLFSPSTGSVSCFVTGKVTEFSYVAMGVLSPVLL